MTPFTALLAPLDVPTTDGLVLVSGGQWALRDAHVPLHFVPTTQPGLAGEVTGLRVSPHAIYCHGHVEEEAVADRMAAGELRPALQLADVTSDYQQQRYRSGLVSAVGLTTEPAWPDLWFRLEPDGRHPAVRFDVADPKAFLKLLAIHTPLLDRIPEDEPALWEDPTSRLPRLADQRAASGRACLRCTDLARRTIITRDGEAGPRWADLCPSCYEWLKEALEGLCSDV
jgi:hypothetical protein